MLTIGDMVGLMQPWKKLKVSNLNNVNSKGERIWSEVLTEAQIYAYWSREIVTSYVIQEEMTICCILK